MSSGTYQLLSDAVNTIHNNHSQESLFGSFSKLTPIMLDAKQNHIKRSKKTRAFTWLVLHASGEKHFVRLDKRQLIQTYELGVPSRDLRLMDTVYDTLGQLLIRDKALVFSMEHVRLIILADKVILPADEDKACVFKDGFHRDLELQIQDRLTALSYCDRCGCESCPFAEEGTGSQAGSVPPLSACGRLAKGESDFFRLLSGGGGGSTTPGSPAIATCDHETPPTFELLVLEAAVGEVGRHLSQATDQLYTQSHSALNALTQKASTSNLEAVRRVKTSHQRFTGRVTAVKDAISRVLEDDETLIRMCLTRRMNLLRGIASVSGPPVGDGKVPLPPLPRQPSRAPLGESFGGRNDISAHLPLEGSLHNGSNHVMISDHMNSNGIARVGSRFGLTNVDGSYHNARNGGLRNNTRINTGARNTGNCNNHNSNSSSSSNDGDGDGEAGFSPFGDGNNERDAAVLAEITADLSSANDRSGSVRNGTAALSSATVRAPAAGSPFLGGGVPVPIAPIQCTSGVSFLSQRLRLVSASRQHSASYAAVQAMQMAAGEPGVDFTNADDHDLTDMENMLESYLMLLDGTASRLQSIGEYIEDTEDLINIQLDYSRNKLIRFEILITTGTFSLAIYGVMAGVLGENLKLPNLITQSFEGFVLMNGLTIVFCLLTFATVIHTLKRQKMI